MKVTDKKKYSRLVEKLVKVYEILYDLSPEDFCEKFYSESFIGLYVDQYNPALIEKLVSISNVNLPRDVEAYQKYALCLKLSHEDAIWHLWGLCTKRVAVLVGRMFIDKLPFPRNDYYDR